MKRLPAVLILTLSAAGLPAQDSDVTRAAREFLALLRPDLKAGCMRPIEGGERTSWSYLPGRRKGVALKALTPAERAAAFAMLRAALSAKGYAKTEGVLLLEGILRETEGIGRDPDLYYVTVFGTPSGDRPWAWRFEGHHLSLNFSSATGRIVSETPAFFGANPARVGSGPHAGLRVLGAEEDLARKLLGSLDPRQRSAAVISDDAPSDILFGPGRKRVPDPAGLPAAEMTEAQRTILLDLIGEYTGNLAPEFVHAQREKIAKAGFDAVRFAWAGGTSAAPAERHYYRIQGPTFVIEYDNTQDGANHVHSVFRDLEDDFGGDLLQRHYASGHAPSTAPGLSPSLKRPS